MIASLIIIVHISACATSASKNNNQNITDEFEKTLTDEENMCVANTIEQFFSDNTPVSYTHLTLPTIYSV